MSKIEFAFCNLGYCFLQGLGVPQDADKAQKYFEKGKTVFENWKKARGFPESWHWSTDHLNATLPGFESTTISSSSKIIPQPDKKYAAKDNYTLQGNRYASGAIAHAEEGNEALAKHLEEEADKNYGLAEDAKLAEKFEQL